MENCKLQVKDKNRNMKEKKEKVEGLGMNPLLPVLWLIFRYLDKMSHFWHATMDTEKNE